MKWQGRRQSDNVEDRRGLSGRGMAVGGVGGLGIVIAILYFLLGGNPADIPQTMQVDQPAAAGSGAAAQREGRRDGELRLDRPGQHRGRLEGAVPGQGETYVAPKLVLFSGQVDSACGYAGASSGPFYCPGDSKVYIDLSFFEQMQRQLNAPGDFALAYVIAHEVGHHVQNLLGINDQVMAQRGRMSEKDFNRIMVRMELQADFLAGVWAHYANLEPGFLESGDVEEGMNAASAVGDDRIMKQTQGYIVPDAFTHGTSEQRVRWFKKGFTTGDINQGDTFGAAVL